MKNDFINKIKLSSLFKINNLTHSFNVRKTRLENEIANTTNDKIKLMKTAQLSNLNNEFEKKRSKLHELPDRADIIQKLLVKGVIVVNNKL